MTEPQVATMRKTLEHILGNPEEWNQETWGQRTSCGTVFCFAGHAAVTVAGAVPTFFNFNVNWNDNDDLNYVADVEAPHRRYSVSEYARVALGLTELQSTYLFAADNSLRRLAELCYLYSDGRVDVLDQLPPATHRDRDREAQQGRHGQITQLLRTVWMD